MSRATSRSIVAPRTLAALVATLGVATLAACAADTATVAPRAASSALAEAAAQPQGGGAAQARDLAAARAATARYHRVEVALADGFVNTVQCVAMPGAGMGIHFVHPARLEDPALDPARPEVLVYEPQADGTLRLVALEYMVPRPLWEAVQPGTPPVLFGEAFEPGPMDSHALHVWVWRHNPSGTFAPMNPTVSCPAGRPDAAQAGQAHAAHASHG
jgi:hypothetical protein